MNAVMVRCSCCAGTGVTELTGEYLATLRELQSLGGEHTGAELGRLMRVNPTAMNNRLVVLYRHGLVTSRIWGRKRLFKAKEVA